MRTADGGEFVYIIDVAPEDVQASYESVEKRGLMLLDDRRGHHVGRSGAARSSAGTP
jgi:hypothetical protein